MKVMKILLVGIILSASVSSFANGNLQGTNGHPKGPGYMPASHPGPPIPIIIIK